MSSLPTSAPYRATVPDANIATPVPDFRSENGLFNTLKKQNNLKSSGKEMFDASVYRNDASTSSFHDMIRSLSEHSAKAQPTAFHHLLARLAQEKRLLRLYTQNVDEIDTSMPPLSTNIPLGPKGPWPQTIQLHGGLRKMVCQKCRNITDLQPDLFKGPVPPLCPACAEIDSVRKTSGQRSHGVGKLRPRMVLYNEHNPDDEAIGSVMMADLRARPDAVIVVGTSLKIPGVKRFLKECCNVVRGRQHGVCMWINRDAVPVGKDFEDCWDLIVKGDCDAVAEHVALKRWDDNSDDVFDECTSSEVERVKERQGKLQVLVDTPKKPFNKKTGMMTPSSQDDESGTKQTKLNFFQQENMSNPASKGKPLVDILSGAKKTTKKVTKPRKSTKPAQAKKQAPRIDNRFAVSKASKQTATGKASAIKVEIEAAPMKSIPPTAARSNGPMPSTPCYTTDNDDLTPVESSPPPPWRDNRTISPKGSLPADLHHILNHE